ncbi:hypothetical protein Tco_0410967 [Tanacetum coccineum]
MASIYGPLLNSFIITSTNIPKWTLTLQQTGTLGSLSGEEAWETIENFTQGQKEWDNPPKHYFEHEIENLKVHVKRLFGNKNVWVEMHRNIAWDKVENLNLQNTPQVPPSFEEATPPVTHPEEVDETIGTPIEGIVPSFDGQEPQPLLNSPSLDVSLGDERGPKPPIKPHSPDSFRMKEVDHLTNNTPPSPHVASFHPKDTYCHYHPCIGDPKKHCGFLNRVY